MSSLLLVLGSLAFPSIVGPEDPPRPYQFISTEADDVSVTGLNERGDITGFEWVEDDKYPGVIGQRPFFLRGQSKVVLPLLKGYTATFPAAVSDDGIVVGHAGKPSTPGAPVPMRNQAFLWDEAGGIRGLGTLPGDASSFASGVTRDGKRISGFSVGANRSRACVWDRVGDEWKATALPQSGPLGSQVVPISGDGRFVAGVDGSIPCLWSRTEDGRWSREDFGTPSSLIPRGVNNSGTVVGLRYPDDGTRRAVLWTRDGGLKTLDLPTGYARSEAMAVNDSGVIVGMVDGPNGSDIGPDAFLFENGHLRLIREGGPNLVGATAINNHRQIAGTTEKAEEEEKPRPDPTKP
ncbi:HAF repeat-containing protein [Tundrisphaera lichenicola]|uniref:HAF repeat-containing protein n=1 Tax=Tundrisphaera lichenicola TaxID=2029860 RepID=UPI003EB7792C